MNKKKLIFLALTLLIILSSSIGVYWCYNIIGNDNRKSIDFSKNSILYDMLDNVYALSYQLDNVGKKEALPKYLTANKNASNSFYQNNILYTREIMKEKKNIKYYAEANNNTLGNTNDDIKNISNNKELQKKYQWYLKINFDENGQFSYDTLNCRVANNQNYELIWNNFKQTYFNYLENDDENAIIHNPTNLTVYFAVPYKINNNSIDIIANYNKEQLKSTDIKNIIPYASFAIMVVCLFMLLYPYKIVKEISIFRYFAKIKLELLIIGMFYAFANMIVLIYRLIIDTFNGFYLNRLTSIGFNNFSELILGIMNILSWSTLFILCMFSIYYLKNFFKEGVVNSIKNNTVCSWAYGLSKKIITQVSNFNFTDNTNKTIIKIVIINFLIISIICCFSLYGILLAIVYSALLFVILKNKLTAIKHNYQILLNAVQHLSNGNFDVEINQDIGVFNSLGTGFTSIKKGFEKAVSEEVKSQKMKTELISNVSHDLKTPLTSIITYIDLLKANNLDNNKRKEYLDTLNHNAFRLKNLIDDLFEVSKVNSGNVKLNLVEVDIVALIQQAKLELDDKFNEKQLVFKTSYPDNKIILLLDSLKTYRVFENLLINISKYALENTRVYLNIIDYKNEVKIIFKNISANEIKVSEDELVERFVQGDTSRNTSGSGLGLAIAKSFIELQNGTFSIIVDGDLFKAIIIFKK